MHPCQYLIYQLITHLSFLSLNFIESKEQEIYLQKDPSRSDWSHSLSQQPRQYFNYPSVWHPDD